MRDRKDNAVIVCSIENLDPMGVHTGDSVTVAPALTLTDREYQVMRDASIAIMREIGVDTGGANVQFAQNPRDGRLVVIEMNPRVSRSSALASKATGFPIAKLAAKLAIGYTLDELMNDVTKASSACFEPSLDYVAVKAPRFNFEKFPGASPILGTQMKAVGETMALGRTFKEALQKAIRGLETGHAGLVGDGADAEFDRLSDAGLSEAVATPSAERLFAVRSALARGWSVERLHGLSGIDPWFLREMREIVHFAIHLSERPGGLEGLKSDPALFRQAKAFGFSDRQLARLSGADEDQTRRARQELGLRPSYHLVDTCAGEFASATPYYYSTYGAAPGESAPLPDLGGRRRVMIIGGGPNRIGQGLEFDYCCCHAAYALRESGFASVMVNSNPETVSTDYDTSDILYFEPLTVEDVLEIQHRENCFGAIVQFGGQTPLNLAAPLAANGVPVVGTSVRSIEIAEDRELFGSLMEKLGIRQPPHAMASGIQEALASAEKVGYPVLVRPSFVLGGRNMAIVHDRQGLENYMRQFRKTAGEAPILIDHYLDRATEVDVDCVSDGTEVVIGGIMEHIEIAGIHSGDSACALPPPSLSEGILDAIRAATRAMALGLEVRGLMNVQFAVREGEVYVLEANPRASRTVPFVSKATGVPLAKMAAWCMMGFTLKDLGFTAEPRPAHYSVKEAGFPFNRFPGAAVSLTPEMKSTGEVMGMDRFPGAAFLKSQLAAGNRIPESGNIFISLRNADKKEALPLIKSLAGMGFTLHATRGTSTALRSAGVKSHALFKISEGRPNVMDLADDLELAWIVNTIEPGAAPARDEGRMRSLAVVRGIPITTTLDGLRAALSGLEFMRRHRNRFEVCSLQEFNRKSPGFRPPAGEARHA